MRLLEHWLGELTPAHRILDVGCGGGSLRAQLAGLNVVGVDIDPQELAHNTHLPSVCAESHTLPFASESFDFVICHHSLEHFRDARRALREIRRVMKLQGRLFVSVPDGGSFSDRLYRLLLCGGGHFQRFSFESVVGAVESDMGLHLAGWRNLFTSFIYVDKRNFLAAPEGRLPGPLPRRMRWLGYLPGWCFATMRLLLNLVSRLADRCFSTRLSRYGWALAFGPESGQPLTEAGCWNVCMCCGSSSDQVRVKRVGAVFYRCPYCAQLNFYFGD